MEFGDNTKFNRPMIDLFLTDLFLTRIVRGDPADTDYILECAALDPYRAVCKYFDDRERASRISGGRDLRIVA